MDARETLAADDGLARAVAVALERAEAGDGTMTWAAVSGELSAEQWGGLLDSGLVVATDAGFVFDDPDEVRAALDELDVDDEAAAELEATCESDGGWSAADKVAGAGALGLMASYQVPLARDTIGGTLHLLLGPVEATLPFPLTVLLLAIATTALTTTLRSRLANGNERELVKERMQDVSERLEAARERGDDEAVDRLRSRQQELMGEQLSVMKSMLRPMVWTMLVTIPVFLWLSWLTVNPAAAITPAAQVLPLAGRVVWTARLVGPMQVWMVWYFLCSVASNLLGKRLVRRAKPVVAQYRSVV